MKRCDAVQVLRWNEDIFGYVNSIKFPLMDSLQDHWRLFSRGNYKIIWTKCWEDELWKHVYILKL